MMNKFISIACVAIIGIAQAGISNDDVVNALKNQQSSELERAWAVVMRNGELLATANVGCKDWKPTASEFVYECGSVIKPFTAAIAINEGVISGLDAEYSTTKEDAKYYKLPSDGCHVWANKISVADALVKSSNIVFGKLSADIGADKLYSGLSAFGFGSGRGILPKPEKWNKVMQSRIGIGQGMTATPVQIAKAYSILANHGRTFGTDAKQVVKTEIADAVCKELKRVCTNEGTASKAVIDGVTVAGKTGTAQRIVDGRYADGCYNATFVGIVNDYVIVVVIECAKGSRHQGGDRPVLAFKEIAQKLINK